MNGWTIEQRILFMSESDMLLQFIEENLDKEMYEIEVLDCEVEDVESVEKLHPDLILFDVEGEVQEQRWNLLDEVKHHGATANIPVLLCTDMSQELREQERDFQMLNIQLLYRPFSQDELLKALQQIVLPLKSAFDTEVHERNMSVLQRALSLLTSFGKKLFPQWMPAFIERFNGEMLPDGYIQKPVEQEDQAVSMDKGEQPLERGEREQEEVLVQDSSAKTEQEQSEAEEQEDQAVSMDKGEQPLESGEREREEVLVQDSSAKTEQEQSAEQHEQKNGLLLKKEDCEALSLTG